MALLAPLITELIESDDPDATLRLPELARLMPSVPVPVLEFGPEMVKLEFAERNKRSPCTSEFAFVKPLLLPRVSMRLAEVLVAFDMVYADPFMMLSDSITTFAVVIVNADMLVVTSTSEVADGAPPE